MHTCHATLRTSRSAIFAPTLISQIALPDLYASYGCGFRRRSCGRYSFSRFSPRYPVKGPFQTTPPPLAGSSEMAFMHMDIRNIPVSVFGQLIECHVRPDSFPTHPTEGTYAAARIATEDDLKSQVTRLGTCAWVRCVAQLFNVQTFDSQREAPAVGHFTPQ
jgi:hypothetical protein